MTRPERNNYNYNNGSLPKDYCNALDEYINYLEAQSKSQESDSLPPKRKSKCDYCGDSGEAPYESKPCPVCK
jgi:hypothetical protein